jgi:23S rRNA U2552 (ribose-2'-O)-methylase RlmE/FtsJ
LWLKGDFQSEEIQLQITQFAPQFEVLLCDAAPSYSGQQSLDHLRLIELAISAKLLALQWLKPKVEINLFSSRFFLSFLLSF